MEICRCNPLLDNQLRGMFPGCYLADGWRKKTTSPWTPRTKRSSSDRTRKEKSLYRNSKMKRGDVNIAWCVVREMTGTLEIYMLDRERITHTEATITPPPGVMKPVATVSPQRTTEHLHVPHDTQFNQQKGKVSITITVHHAFKTC